MSASPPELDGGQPGFRLINWHPAFDRDANRASLLWAVFLLCTYGAVSLFFIPAYIIRPFPHQAPRALLLAMTLRQRAPLGTLISGVTCFIFAIALWRTASRRGKSVVALTLIFVTFSAV